MSDGPTLITSKELLRRARGESSRKGGVPENNSWRYFLGGVLLTGTLAVVGYFSGLFNDDSSYRSKIRELQAQLDEERRISSQALADYDYAEEAHSRVMVSVNGLAFAMGEPLPPRDYDGGLDAADYIGSFPKGAIGQYCGNEYSGLETVVADLGVEAGLLGSPSSTLASRTIALDDGHDRRQGGRQGGQGQQRTSQGDGDSVPGNSGSANQTSDQHDQGNQGQGAQGDGSLSDAGIPALGAPGGIDASSLGTVYDSSDGNQGNQGRDSGRGVGQDARRHYCLQMLGSLENKDVDVQAQGIWRALTVYGLAWLNMTPQDFKAGCQTRRIDPAVDEAGLYRRICAGVDVEAQRYSSLMERFVDVVKAQGLVQGNGDGTINYELSCAK